MVEMPRLTRDYRLPAARAGHFSGADFLLPARPLALVAKPV